MNQRETIIKDLVKAREVVLSGGVNAIPSPFTRFRRDFPGIQRLYYVVTGGTKASKTQLCQFLFVFTPIFYWIEHPDQISKPKIFMFPLEESPRNITLRYYSHLINKFSGIKISPLDLKSIDERRPLPDEVLEVMNTEQFKRYADAFEECVEFREESNPTGMYHVVKDYMEKNGKIIYKDEEVTYTDDMGIKRTETIKSFDSYIPNDPKHYVFSIRDHVGLIDLERGTNTLKDAIERDSKNLVRLRNRYGVVCVSVQQQNSEKNIRIVCIFKK